MTFRVSTFARSFFGWLPALYIIIFLLITFISWQHVPLKLQYTNASLRDKTVDAIPAEARCGESSVRPNVVLTAIDGPRWLDQMFIFCQSLELALGRDALLSNQQHNGCPPAQVVVKIIAPPELVWNLPEGFKILMRRYSFLEFIGALPEGDVNVVLRRFQGFSDVVGDVSSAELSYNKILVCDLDVVFQRNPFIMPMKPGTELLYFTEWRGLKIGQDKWNWGWFRGCAQAEGGPFITEEQIALYQALQIICAGSVYGTAGAISVYLQTMASELHKSGYQCNDQAMHMHIYFSNLLDAKLTEAKVGRVWMVPDEESLLGTVGTTPMVRFNEWGEILNELGEVQVAVHQYKHHIKLTEIVWKRFGWMADISTAVVPPVPALTEEKDGSHISDSHEPSQSIPRFKLEGLSSANCSEDKSLCSCRHDNCQMDYKGHI